MKKLFVLVFTIALCLGILCLGASAAGDHGEHTDSKWKQLTEETTTLKPGNYYLSEDVTCRQPITVTGDYNIAQANKVTICLNGHVLDLDGNYIKVTGDPDDKVSLILCDCTSEKTKGYIDSNGLWKRGEAPAGATTCDLIGGVITGGNGNDMGNGNKFGGAVYVKCGDFIMYGGNIAGNSANQGGGVYADDSNGSFTMYGGAITGNTANHGGGVFINRGNFRMEGGSSITGNTAAYYGGGVYVQSGGFVMSGIPSITGNTANRGGGVYVTGGSFIVSSGSITDNTATNGGGVYVADGTFTLSGGSITNNTATNGGGVYVADGTFTLSGGSINNNKTNGDAASNVYLSDGKTITIGGTLSTSPSIGVSMATPGVFTSGLNGGNLSCFFSDRTGYYVALDGGEAKLFANTYTVTLHTNGGTINSGNVNNYTYGQGAELPTDIEKPGYTFAGWYDNEGLTGSPVTSISTTDSGDKTYYAKWTAMTYNVTLHTNGGTINSGNVTNYTYGQGAELPTDIEKTGYTFAGWYDNDQFIGDAVTSISTTDYGDKIYYAKWTAMTYTVTLNTNGGTINSGNVTNYTYGQGAELPTDIEKTGYTFVGWYDNDKFIGDAVAAISATDYGDKTYYAKWTANTYTVTLHLNGGKFAEDAQDVTSYTYGTTTPLPDAEQVTRSGYRFEGWYADEKFQDGPYTEISDTAVGDKEFYARWSFINSPDIYDIIVVDPANGSVKANPSNGSAATLITITATPDEGYELAYITVDGEKISGNTFRMPDHDVTVSAVFVPVSFPFTDVKSGDWFYDYVAYVYANGLMDGTSATTFEPNAKMTRAMVWAILARIDGEEITGANWVTDARAWAMAEGVSDGTDPNGYVTREQFVTMLYRYAVAKGYDVSIGESTNILSYADFDEISEWAIPAMQWGCGSGVITGVTDTTLVPQGTATRAQCAAMLMRFVESVK